MTNDKLDYLIVGQGLAGSVLSYHLLREGLSIRVINETKAQTASWVAAGLYNPITGRKMVKTWEADTLFPYLQAFYAELETVIGRTVLYPLPIYRPFASIAEQSDWAGKSGNMELVPYVREVFYRSHYKEYIHDALGGIVLDQCGYVDVPTLLEGCQQYLKAQGVYEEGRFDPPALHLEADGVTYQQWKARKIIFCDGAEGSQNSFFSWLPFQPVKGEILLIKPEKKIDIIFNRGVFIVPYGDFCKVGATYDHHDLTFDPTVQGRNTLVQKLDQLWKIPYTIEGQVAGVRPATHDRHPFVGVHPQQETLAVFGGLGTKGVSLAPYFAHQLVALLTENRPVAAAVDIRRYYH